MTAAPDWPLPYDLRRYYTTEEFAQLPDHLEVIEIVTPNSVRTDTVVKPLEYAEAGIPHFWLIDPKPPVTATVYRLVDGHYEEFQRAERTLTVTEPCPIQINLDALLPARRA